ncbi:hypothetical protein SRB5_65940 [Streptomyces sp. RB5]|uniref:DUF2079 domain-containing protein n=1 Tax=Streptomyces smaragdinus TaxID=2585196 RepID=A0A7K0CSC4_9ACTN|nr:DUF2079 domain-containing protein [Streptomyces smaragdinus]MQY16395.1 hypothetical protein [Streptomyces smaragdinus]
MTGTQTGTVVAPRTPGDDAAAEERVPWRPYLWLFGGLFAAYSLYSQLQLAHFGSPSWDLAIFEQEVRAYSDFRSPVVDIKGPGFMILGDHFSPLVALLVPLYWIWPSPAALLVAQAALFAGSAVIVGRTAARFLGRRAGVGLALAYGLSWGVQEAVKADFHEVALAVPLLALVCRALLLERWRAAALWSLPLLLVKEDLGITVAVVGGLLFWYGQRRLGVALAGTGLVAFAVTVWVLIPAANSAGRYDYWTKVSVTGEDQQPGLMDSVLDVFSNSVKIEMVFFVFAVTGFLALRSPLAALALPTLGWRLLSHEPYHWGMGWHYSATLMPIVFLAAADGVRRARNSPRPWLASYAKVAVPVMTAASLALTQHLPLRDLLRPETYHSDPRIEAAKGALEAIPPGASVEADVPFLAHLTADHRVYWLGGAESVTPDAIAVRATYAGADPVAYANQLHPGEPWRLVFQQDEYVVLLR